MTPANFCHQSYSHVSVLSLKCLIVQLLISSNSNYNSRSSNDEKEKTDSYYTERNIKSQDNYLVITKYK